MRRMVVAAALAVVGLLGVVAGVLVTGSDGGEAEIESARATAAKLEQDNLSLSEEVSELAAARRELERDLRHAEAEMRRLGDQVGELQDSIDRHADKEDDSDVSPVAPFQAEEPPAVSVTQSDPATVSQFIKSVFRERLERDPDDEELATEVDWYLAEEREGGDTRARWLERFERGYQGELRLLERRREDDERRARQEECRQNYREAYGEEPPSYYCMSG